MGVGLKPHLPDGTYTGTYRVISADTHVVYGGLVFNIGHPGAAPKYTVAGLIGRNEAGHVTKVAFGVVRALDYLSIALMIGGLAFLYAVWSGALAALAGPEPRWSAASDGFARRAWRLLAVAVVLGAVVSLLGVLLQGATAAGVSLWSSLKGTIIESTLESRFGWVWGLRAVDWLLLGALLLGARAAGRDPVPRLTPVADGDGLAGAQRQPPAGVAAGRARTRLRLPRDHPRARRPREHPEPHRPVLPLRRAPRAGRLGVGGRDRLPAARAARRHPPARGPRAHAAAVREPAPLLAAGARVGDRDRHHGRRPGLHRRPLATRAAAHDLRGC